MSETLHGLQAILGTDKKNPMFAVYRDREKSELHVYYGFELLEVVPEDKTTPRFKLMVAQLYNAGVKGVRLVEVFRVEAKCMRKWGRALKSGDPETLVKALQGRGARKLTPAIKAFIRRRFAVLYIENHRNYSSRIRREILEIFDVRLSGEGLRAFFHELKAELHAKSELDACEQPPRSSQEPEDDPPPSPPATELIEHSASHGTGEAEDSSAKKGALAV
jgi:hypothetical protein